MESESEDLVTGVAKDGYGLCGEGDRGGEGEGGDGLGEGRERTSMPPWPRRAEVEKE